jgi:arsenate reductase
MAMFVARKSRPVFAARTRVLHVGFDDPPVLAANTETDETAMAHYGGGAMKPGFFVESLPQVLMGEQDRD